MNFIDYGHYPLRDLFVRQVIDVIGWRQAGAGPGVGLDAAKLEEALAAGMEAMRAGS